MLLAGLNRGAHGSFIRYVATYTGEAAEHSPVKEGRDGKAREVFGSIFACPPSFTFNLSFSRGVFEIRQWHPCGNFVRRVEEFMGSTDDLIGQPTVGPLSLCVKA